MSSTMKDYLTKANATFLAIFFEGAKVHIKTSYATNFQLFVLLKLNMVSMVEKFGNQIKQFCSILLLNRLFDGCFYFGH